jgi:phage portal protein BeeE
VNLLTRLQGGRRPARAVSLEEWIAQLNSFVFNGLAYTSSGISQTLAGNGVERPAPTFEGLARSAYQSNGVVFACMLVRQLVFSSIRFEWQRMRNGKPSDSYGSSALRLFEEPWPGGTTQDLLSRMIQDADLAGNSYWYRETPLVRLGTQDPGELVRLRPDWVQITGVRRKANPVGRNTGEALLSNRGNGTAGWVKTGYIYTEHGVASGGDSVFFTVDEVAHFAPIPDPLAVFTGMSWVTPVLRELQADQAMTKHQSKFFSNGATVNMVIKHDPAANRDAILKWAKELEGSHAGAENAWKNLHLYPGADATPVGSNLKDIDFAGVREGGEVRIAAAAGVPPVIVGLSKGLDSSTYSNYSQARRRLADGTAHPLWQNLAGSLGRIIEAPDSGTRLWYNASDVPFLREDEKDAAAIAAVKAATINSYITAGYAPDSVVAAVEANDLRLLKHSGLYSVQLQQPGAEQPSASIEQRTAGGQASVLTAVVERVLTDSLALPPGETKEDQ